MSLPRKCVYRNFTAHGECRGNVAARQATITSLNSDSICTAALKLRDLPFRVPSDTAMALLGGSRTVYGEPAHIAHHRAFCVHTTSLDFNVHAASCRYAVGIYSMASGVQRAAIPCLHQGKKILDSDLIAGPKYADLVSALPNFPPSTRNGAVLVS